MITWTNCSHRLQPQESSDPMGGSLFLPAPLIISVELSKKQTKARNGKTMKKVLFYGVHDGKHGYYSSSFK